LLFYGFLEKLQLTSDFEKNNNNLPTKISKIIGEKYFNPQPRK
jgi:hypothetical protein